jgi:hypothetical protein
MRLWLTRLLCRSLRFKLTTLHDDAGNAWIIPDERAKR